MSNNQSTINQIENSDKKETVARIGLAAKGIVYTLVGALTVMSAVGGGGKKTGKSGTLDYIAGQSFGQILLIVLAIGLAAYVFYRLYQAFADPADEGTDAKGIAKRAGYVGSAFLYGFLAFKAVETVTSAGGSGGGNGSESMTAQLLSQSYGQILVGLVGLIFLIKAGTQLYRAYSGSYKEKVEHAGLGQKAQELILKAGKIGYTARGLVLVVISYLIFKAAATADSDKAGGTEDAFTYVQNEFGTIVMILLAAGILAYGVFTFIRSKYPGLSLTK